MYLLLYVDDMLIISKSKSLICKLKEKLSAEFEMKDLGNAKKIIGMQIDRNRHKCELRVHQCSYMHKLVEKFGMADAKPVTIPLANHFTLSKSQCPRTELEMIKMEHIPYANVIGSLIYAMISTRPDLAFVISLLSRYMSNPGMDHWIAVKWVMKYVNATLNVGYITIKELLHLSWLGL